MSLPLEWQLLNFKLLGSNVLNVKYALDLACCWPELCQMYLPSTTLQNMSDDHHHFLHKVLGANFS